MAEEAYNKIHGDGVGNFTVTSKSGRNALIRRLDKYDADYEVRDHKIKGEWDSAVISVNSDDLRPIRYLVKT